jgi:hypothetical protein
MDEPDLQSLKEAYKHLRAEHVRVQLEHEKILSEERQMRKTAILINGLPAEQAAAEPKRALQ